MKRLIALLLVVIMVFSLAACKKKKTPSGETVQNPEHHAIITEAVELVKQRWQQSYNDDAANGMTTDRYFEIKNTRVVMLKSNSTQEFHDVQYVIEFEIYSDYLGTSPYYQRSQVYNNVLVHFGGIKEVDSSAIDNYAKKTYKADLSNLIASIDDYQGAYNCAEKLK